MDAPEESDDEPVDFGDVPFGDDDDDMAGPDTPAAAAADDSLLQLSVGRESDVVNISGLEESPDHKKRPSEVTPKRKRRKRRKVIIDNDETELSTEHIKNMIANTSDIVKRQVHPAEPTEEPKKKKAKKLVLTQPFLMDQGPIHPALEKLFRQNFYRALDEPCPFEKEQAAEDVEQVRRDGGAASDLEEDEEEVSTAAPKAEQNDSSDNEPDDFGNDFGMDEEEDQPPEDNMDAPDLDEEAQEEDGVLNQEQGKHY